MPALAPDRSPRGELRAPRNSRVCCSNLVSRFWFLIPGFWLSPGTELSLQIREPEPRDRKRELIIANSMRPPTTARLCPLRLFPLDQPSIQLDGTSRR